MAQTLMFIFLIASESLKPPQTSKGKKKNQGKSDLFKCIIKSGTSFTSVVYNNGFKSILKASGKNTIEIMLLLASNCAFIKNKYKQKRSIFQFTQCHGHDHFN